MKELIQAGVFYESLVPAEKEELGEVLAENIFFLDDALQEKILALLDQVDRRLGDDIRRRNSFTTC